MGVISRTRVLATLLLAAISIASAATAQTRTGRLRSPAAAPRFVQAQSDTIEKPLPALDEVSRRMDSLKFIVVYNAELLQKDFDRKVIWIYAMLGLMIIATVVFFVAFLQARRQRDMIKKELSNRLADTFTELDSKVKKLESLVTEHRAAWEKKLSRRRKTR